MPASPFRNAFRLGATTSALMFGLIVLGSVVRTTGSGLACPDWPLCHGQLIPPLQFNILVEWFHRLVALLVGLLLFATVGIVLARPATRARLGAFAIAALALYFTQALLGALTVWKLLHPTVVNAHLGCALLLFATLLTLTNVARAESALARTATRPAGMLAAFAAVTALVYGQALLGGGVSTNYAALACPDWPTCNGQWFPRLDGAVGLQMIHRYGAYAVTLAIAALAIRARASADARVRAGGTLAFGLVLAQVALGVLNVFLGVPVWLSALHLATATALFALLVTLTTRVALAPAGARIAGPVAAA